VFGFSAGIGDFLFCKMCEPVLGPIQPHIQWVMGASLSRVKQLGLETDHKPPTSAVVKNAWTYTSTPPYAFMACTGTAFTRIFTDAVLFNSGKVILVWKTATLTKMDHVHPPLQ
jgi:hypothetical protein